MKIFATNPPVPGQQAIVIIQYYPSLEADLKDLQEELQGMINNGFLIADHKAWSGYDGPDRSSPSVGVMVFIRPAQNTQPSITIGGQG